LTVRAYVAHYQGENDTASSLANEGLALAIAIDAPRGIAYSTALFGMSAYAQGQLGRAKEHLLEALSIFRKVDDQRNVVLMLVSLARTAYRQGDRASAAQYLEESLTIARQLDILWCLAYSLEIMGLLQRSQGHFNRAFELFRESLLISAEQDNLQGVLNCLGALAGLAAMDRQPGHAARLFAAAEKLRQKIGAKMGRDDREEYEDYLAMLHHQLPDAAFKTAWSEGDAMTVEQAIKEVEGWGRREIPV
jgi:tetratricopeptide (TPR) repeat protein